MTKRQLWNKLKKLNGSYKKLGNYGGSLLVEKGYRLMVIHYNNGGYYKGQTIKKDFKNVKKEYLLKLLENIEKWGAQND